MRIFLPVVEKLLNTNFSFIYALEERLNLASKVIIVHIPNINYLLKFFINSSPLIMGSKMLFKQVFEAFA